LKKFILTNPYLPICTPMALAVLQFLAFILLFNSGLPFFFRKDALGSSLFLVAFFGLSMVTVPAMLLGVRQLIYSSNKFFPAIGVAFNLVYLVGFLSFFVLVFLTQTLT